LHGFAQQQKPGCVIGDGQRPPEYVPTNAAQVAALTGLVPNPFPGIVQNGAVSPPAYHQSSSYRPSGNVHYQLYVAYRSLGQPERARKELALSQDVRRNRVERDQAMVLGSVNQKVNLNKRGAPIPGLFLIAPNTAQLPRILSRPAVCKQQFEQAHEIAIRDRARRNRERGTKTL
jgi:hypothetical protein